jgi:hypothetical protein
MIAIMRQYFDKLEPVDRTEYNELIEFGEKLEKIIEGESLLKYDFPEKPMEPPGEDLKGKKLEDYKK